MEAWMEIITLVSIPAILALIVGIFYGWLYRGWHLRKNGEERQKTIISILSHLDHQEREEFFNFIERLRISKSTIKNVG